MTTLIRCGLAAFFACLCPALAQAQTGDCPPDPGFQISPTRGCFKPVLAEHNQPPDPVTGAQKVTRYEVWYYAEGVDPATGQPVQAATSIGKPTPNPQGAIWFGQGTATPLPAYPLGQRLRSLIVAVGAGGSAPKLAAELSNSFGTGAVVTAPTAPSSYRLVP